MKRSKVAILTLATVMTIIAVLAGVNLTRHYIKFFKRAINQQAATIGQLNDKVAAIGARLPPIDAQNAQSATLAQFAESIAITNARLAAIDAKIVGQPLDMGESDYRTSPAPVLKSPLPFGGADPRSYKVRTQCDLSDPKRTIVLLALGQSNAANYTGAMVQSTYGGAVMNYYQGRCYVAADPLLGADGNSGSLWTELANRLISTGQADRVMIVPLAVGGSSMIHWQPGGDLYQELGRLIDALEADHISITDTVWVQGEAERYSDSPFYEHAEKYASALKSIIALTRKYGISRFYVSMTSSCSNQAYPSKPTRSIREAQMSVLSTKDQIFSGPDIDGINEYADRFDACHLTLEGASKAIVQLMASIRGAALHESAKR